MMDFIDGWGLCKWGAFFFVAPSFLFAFPLNVLCINPTYFVACFVRPSKGKKENKEKEKKGGQEKSTHSIVTSTPLEISYILKFIFVLLVFIGQILVIHAYESLTGKMSRSLFGSVLF